MLPEMIFQLPSGVTLSFPKISTNLEAFANFMQTETLKSTHAHKSINILQHNPSIRLSIITDAIELVWDQSLQHSTTEGRNGRGRGRMIRQARLLLQCKGFGAIFRVHQSFLGQNAKRWGLSLLIVPSVVYNSP
jgi:hypothetical protein